MSACISCCGVVVACLGIVAIGIGAAGLAGHLSLHAANVSAVVLGALANPLSLLPGILGLCGVITNVNLISGFILGGGLMLTAIGACKSSCLMCC